jgi:hypothetical protein
MDWSVFVTFRIRIQLQYNFNPTLLGCFISLNQNKKIINYGVKYSLFNYLLY